MLVAILFNKLPRFTPMIEGPTDQDKTVKAMHPAKYKHKHSTTS